MTAERSRTFRSGVLAVLVALIFAAGCAGGSAEPAQVPTTTSTEVTGTEAPAPETTAAGPTGETDPTETPDAGPTGETDPAQTTGTTAPQRLDATVRGTVTYRERIALTPGATLTVQIRDTSYADAAAELIAERVIPDPGQVPIRFEVPYASARIEARNTYSISARITEADGRLAFINDTAYDVITGGNPTNVDLVLVLVEPPPEMVDGEWSAEDRQPVEQPVTVTASAVIREGRDIYVRVAFVISPQDGCYRRGREEATVDGTDVNVAVTAWVPPPAPWAIDCSDETLELDAVAHVADGLVSGQTYTVVINGEAARTFVAP